MSLREQVEALVADIPRGRVMTYGDIAACVGHPGAGRMVGMIAATGSPDLPWQRVVNHAGRLALSYPDQAEDLRADGVDSASGRVVGFARLRWQPEWIR